MRLQVLSLLACALFAGCSRPEAPAGTLRIGIGAEVATLDPHLVQGVSEARVLSALYDGLVLPSTTAGEVRPGVAQSWEISADGMRYTFQLNPKAKWSNGLSLSAEDFVWSWQRALSPSLAAPNAYMLSNIAGVKAQGAHTLSVELKVQDPVFLAKLTHPIFYPVNRACVEASGDPFKRGSLWARPGKLVSNGAFILKEHAIYRRLVVERNTNDATPAELARIEFYPIDNRSSEEMAFLSGQLDITSSLPLNKVRSYQHDNRLRIDPALQVEYVLVNTRLAPFDNKQVRRALSLSLNREAICRELLKAGQTPAHTFLPPQLAIVGADPLSENIAEAKATIATLDTKERTELAKANYRFNSSEARKAVAEALQDQWRSALGVSIGLENLEWKTFLSARASGDYTLARAGWSADIADASNFLELFTSNNPNNSTGWSHTEYDRLVRERKFAEAEAILLRELPMIPLYFTPNVYLISQRITGWQPSALDQHDWREIGLRP